MEISNTELAYSSSYVNNTLDKKKRFRLAVNNGRFLTNLFHPMHLS